MLSYSTLYVSMSVCNGKIAFSIDPKRADIMKDITVNFVLIRSSGLYIQGQEKKVTRG